MAQFYVARFRGDPIVMGVPFQLEPDEDLVTAAVTALMLHTADPDMKKPWELRIAGPFTMGPERIELIDPKDHLG